MEETLRGGLCATEGAEKSGAAQAAAVQAGDHTAPARAGLINASDFARTDLRVARIVSARVVPGADELLSLELDLGEPRPRTVLAGIRRAYTPEELKGKLVIAVANLEARHTRFGVSEAMLLAAGSGETLTLVVPEKSATVGVRIA